jgi:hypothetical protein|tara:strand:+ start:198 stop:350 length:153 start_codon:yes stop_codon:yes gene_type:complete
MLIENTSVVVSFKGTDVSRVENTDKKFDRDTICITKACNFVRHENKKKEK